MAYVAGRASGWVVGVYSSFATRVRVVFFLLPRPGKKPQAVWLPEDCASRSCPAAC